MYYYTILNPEHKLVGWLESSTKVYDKRFTEVSKEDFISLGGLLTSDKPEVEKDVWQEMAEALKKGVDSV